MTPATNRDFIFFIACLRMPLECFLKVKVSIGQNYKVQNMSANPLLNCKIILCSVLSKCKTSFNCFPKRRLFCNSSLLLKFSNYICIPPATHLLSYACLQLSRFRFECHNSVDLVSSCCFFISGFCAFFSVFCYCLLWPRAMAVSL